MPTDPVKQKTVLVCGDLVWDTHVARLQFDPKGYFQPHLQSQLSNRHGGAWYLRDVIENALQAANIAADVISPEKASHVDIEECTGAYGGIAKGFSVWEWFKGQSKPATVKQAKDGSVEYKWPEGEAEPGAWRIREFLGCQQAHWADGQRQRTSCPALPDFPGPLDLMVIDDLGLGFADHPDGWPGCLSAQASSAPQILAKATPPFDRPLWRRLLAPEWASKLTVVVAAAALRDHGARLSCGFSWDQTIQEVKAEFAPGGVGWALRHCHRVVVLFGRSGAVVFSRVPLSRDEGKPPATLHFERFVFDPGHLEGTWAPDLKGTTFGTISVMTAMFAGHALAHPQPSTHLTASRGLAAARELHRIGGGHDEAGFNLYAADLVIFANAMKGHPEMTFKSAFPRESLDQPVLAKKGELPPPEKQTLLTDALGLASAFLAIGAENIVRQGREKALRSVPRLEYGKYFTVDREEIERLNTVRNLILDYTDNKADKLPLSLAVFGPPGSGKSFAIKELSEALFGQERAVLEFNLSQFQDLASLHEAFHEVRDKSVQNQMPFVFWDEFDSPCNGVPLGWLKEFLAPMQDAKFVANGKGHPFGKCIFIFAGGTSATFSEFIRPIDRDYQPRKAQERNKLANARDSFKAVKGPDFVSRLRGYVNIKGPNPASDKGDEVHIIRRAILLRSLIEKHHKDILNPTTKELAISPSVLHAFLRVGDDKEGNGYRHGARSMEAIVSLSRLHHRRHFGPSELPPDEVVDLHITPDFSDKVRDKTKYRLGPADIERLAEIIHEKWRKTKAGYIYGPVRNDKANPKTHPLYVEYAELTEPQKEGNRLPARLTALRLEALGYDIVPADPPNKAVVRNPKALPLDKLKISEHRRWMREKLLDGVAFAPSTNDDLLLHKDICKFTQLPEEEQKLDDSIIRVIFEFLQDKGLALVKKSGDVK